jgi:hypothetical protein
MSARTEELESTAPFHQATPSVSSHSTSSQRAKAKISQQLKGIVGAAGAGGGGADDPFGDITFSDEEDHEEDNFAIQKVLKMTKNKVTLSLSLSSVSHLTSLSFFTDPSAWGRRVLLDSNRRLC